MRLRSLLLLVCLAVVVQACRMPLTAEMMAASGDVLLSDEFDDPASGWLILEAEAGRSEYYLGSLRIQVSQPGYDFWSTAGQDFSNVHIEVDAAKAVGSDSNRIGIICRYQDPANFYFFIISTDGYYGIGKVKAELASLLTAPQMLLNPAIRTGSEVNHLRADCVGDTLILYVNSLPVGMTTDSDFAHGDVGLLAGTFEDAPLDVLFDHFSVVKP